MASRVELQPSSPSLIFYPYKQRPALAGWIADERSATFVVVSHDGTPQQLEGFRLKEVEEEEQAAQHKQQQKQEQPSGECAEPS
jgi:hypothetical protein